MITRLKSIIDSSPAFLSAGLALVLFTMTSCKPGVDFPVWVDNINGSFIYSGETDQMGPVFMNLNGSNPLKGAFLFQEKDSLVCINSCGELDVIFSFLMDGQKLALRTRVLNTGKENLEITNLEPFILPTGVCPFDIQIQEDQPWELSFQNSGDSLSLSLFSGRTAVVLLPEEKLILPALFFTPFSHPKP